ncbi:MAG TPA: MFS transporter [Iamia sp.]|nr:MFS transporter [Iamia sp.]
MSEERESHPVAFGYLFGVYLLAGAGETFVSPLFPIVREELGLRVADQALLTAALTVAIGIANLAGGWMGTRHGDRAAVRLSAALVAVGCGLSGAAPGLAVLAVGQAVTGLGVGLFFGPGLALIGRMYVRSRGRAIASYGLAYSLGLAAAAFSTNAGASGWRAVFFATAVSSGILALLAPALPDAVADSPPTVASLWAETRGHLASPGYRLALLVGVVAGTNHYVVAGLTPEHFVARGVALGLAAGLVGVGRLASVGGKVVAGRLFDRHGGRRTVQVVVAATIVSGVLLLLPPGRIGLVAVVPFVCTTAMLFPVSNAVVIGSLPGHATWGVGVYRCVLVGSAAACAGLVSLALTATSTTVVMVAALVIPLAVLAVTFAPSFAGVAGPPVPTSSPSLESA